MPTYQYKIYVDEELRYECYTLSWLRFYKQHLKTAGLKYKVVKKCII